MAKLERSESLEGIKKPFKRNRRGKPGSAFGKLITSPTLARELKGFEIVAIKQPQKGGKTKYTLKTFGKIEQTSDTEFLIETVANDTVSALDLDSFEPDAKAQAMLRGVEQANSDIKAAGGAFSLEETCLLLGGISRQAVHRKVQSGIVFRLKAPGGRVVFPTLQFTSQGPVAGLNKVIAAFPSNNRWMLLNFLVQPDDRLGAKRPIDVLLSGDVDSVVSAARALGEQSA